MKYLVNCKETDYGWVYGNLLKNIERVKFVRLLAALETTQEDAVYSFNVMGHRQQYLWVLVQSPCRDYGARQKMGQRLHQCLQEKHLTGGWEVYLKQLPYSRLN